VNGIVVAANGLCGETGMAIANVIISHCVSVAVDSLSHSSAELFMR